MGFFGKLFDKKECSVCGNEIGLLGNRKLEDANPDVLSFSDVTGCKLDIDESKTEIEYEDAEGNRQSFDPRRYAYSYNFYIVLNVNNPYFNEIRFLLNSSAVDNDEETLLDGPEAVRRSRGGIRGDLAV